MALPTVNTVFSALRNFVIFSIHCVMSKNVWSEYLDVLKPPGSLLATDGGKAVVLV